MRPAHRPAAHESLQRLPASRAGGIPQRETDACKLSAQSPLRIAPPCTSRFSAFPQAAPVPAHRAPRRQRSARASPRTPDRPAARSDSDLHSPPASPPAARRAAGREARPEYKYRHIRYIVHSFSRPCGVRRQQDPPADSASSALHGIFLRFMRSAFLFHHIVSVLSTGPARAEASRSPANLFFAGHRGAEARQAASAQQCAAKKRNRLSANLLPRESNPPAEKRNRPSAKASLLTASPINRADANRPIAASNRDAQSSAQSLHSRVSSSGV